MGIKEQVQEWISSPDTIGKHIGDCNKLITDLLVEVERLEKEDNALTIFSLMEDVRKLQAQLSEVQGDYEQLNNRYYEVTQKYEAQLSRYQGAVEEEAIVIDANYAERFEQKGTIITEDIPDLPKEWIGQRVRVLVMPAEVGE